MKYIEKLLSFFLIICIILSSSYFILKRCGVVSAGASDDSKTVHYTQSYIYKNSYFLKIKISGSKKACFLINGEPADYETDGDYFAVEVSEGDVLGLDARRSEGDEITFFVADCDENVLYPKKGTKLFVSGGIQNLFTVRINNN